MSKISIFWFRRDLRLRDNAGLYHALKSGTPVLPIFIFDKKILDHLPEEDARVEFIHNTLTEMNTEFTKMGSSMDIRYGDPSKVWHSIMDDYDIEKVYTNRDYEPYAKKRDQEISELLVSNGISFIDYKDHVLFDNDEVLKADNTPYTVFTPYSKKWREKLDTRGEGKDSYYLKAYPNEKYFASFVKMQKKYEIPSLRGMGFKEIQQDIPPDTVSSKLIANYQENRNFPAIDGTSKLGVHYRFGTVSIREKAQKAINLSSTYVNELIWRDFYSNILNHYPHVVKGSFREKYDKIEWRFEEEEYRKWCEGNTGYPIVDAGMRELNATGYMHNRVRMIVASFLTKHLMTDWRHGEAYFAQKLLDYDLASNNGGWQWAAGSGTDAAPYFRIFNPTSQMEKFDKDLKYVKKWVPEYGTSKYPKPMVDHKEARERCLRMYKEALN